MSTELNQYHVTTIDFNKSSSKCYPVCKYCGKRLTNPDSIHFSLGATCHQKLYQNQYKKSLFTIKGKELSSCERHNK